MDSVDVIKISDNIEDLRERLDVISTQLITLTSAVNKLQQTVVGDNIYGQMGLVREVDAIKKYIDNDKIRNGKIMGGLTVVGIIWTAILKYILN